jgi:hypothetical protein
LLPSSEGWPAIIIESLAVDPAGNAYVVGSSLRSVPHELTDNDEAGFVVRFTADGTLAWAARLPALSVAIHPSGDVYLATVRGAADGSEARETALVKYDSAGAEVWSKKLSLSLFDLPDGHWDSIQPHRVSIPADGARIFMAAEIYDAHDDRHELIPPRVLAEFDRDGALIRRVTLTEGSAPAFRLQGLATSPFGSRSFVGQFYWATDTSGISAVEDGRVLWRHAEHVPTRPGARFFAVDVEGNLVVVSQDAGDAGSRASLGRLSGSTGSLL